jgi:hypothetical protein
MKPTFIIGHHSATKDGQVNDWEAIKRYHTSWRYQGKIISEQEGLQRIAAGVKGVERPWSAIGYHYGLEMVNGVYVWKEGRKPNVPGAHCKEQGMNGKSLGVCVVGDYDKEPVPSPMFELLVMHFKDLMQQYSIFVANVQPHRLYAPYKSCPGTQFQWDELIARLV